MGTAIFPTGSTTIFKQSTAPVGWTKVTTYNNYTLRIVSGSVSSGGTVDFSTAMVNTTYTGVAGPSLDPNNPNFSVSSQEVLAAIPAHQHPAPASRSFPSGTALPAAPTSAGLNAKLSAIGIGSSQLGPVDGGSTHSHAITGSTTFAGGSKNFGVNYFDIIIASID
jgi:hypothetical protein